MDFRTRFQKATVKILLAVIVAILGLRILDVYITTPYNGCIVGMCMMLILDVIDDMINKYYKSLG